MKSKNTMRDALLQTIFNFGAIDKDGKEGSDGSEGSEGGEGGGRTPLAGTQTLGGVLNV